MVHWAQIPNGISIGSSVLAMRLNNSVASHQSKLLPNILPDYDSVNVCMPNLVVVSKVVCVVTQYARAR